MVLVILGSVLFLAGLLAFTAVVLRMRQRPYFVPIQPYPWAHTSPVMRLCGQILIPRQATSKARGLTCVNRLLASKRLVTLEFTGSST